MTAITETEVWDAADDLERTIGLAPELRHDANLADLLIDIFADCHERDVFAERELVRRFAQSWLDHNPDRRAVPK